MLETGIPAGESSLPNIASGVTAKVENQRLTVQGLREYAAQPGSTLKLTAETPFGARITEETRPLTDGVDAATWDLPEQRPGQSYWVTVAIDSPQGRLDSERILVSHPTGGSPYIWQPDPPGIKLTDVFATETLNIFQPLDEHKADVDVFLAGMKQRGSTAVQLNSNWLFIEMQRGSYDWSRLDSYVNYLTAKKTPFVLATVSSALFMSMPFDIWGEWMLDHRGEAQVWRDIPVVTPMGPQYRTAARDLVAKMVARYKSNPYLLGYNFINQGADSAIFFDNAGSVTDYSPWAREQFRDFLRARYTTVAALNQRWGSSFTHWDTVEPPLPNFDVEVDITPAWQDFTAFKMVHFRGAVTGLFDDVVRKEDPTRPITHYAGYTGPVEYLFEDFRKNGDIMADGGGEDVTMARLNGLAYNWGVGRNTESHAVPPANRLAMQDMTTNLLRYGLKENRFNLVWNTLVELHRTRYPQQADLQSSMAWWSANIPRLEPLRNSIPEPSRVGAVLSWSDMFYRTRLWRWYAMPGRTVDDMTQAASLLPVTWVTEVTPESRMQNLSLVIVPSDARVLDTALIRKLSAFVERGGKLAVWGRAGEYTPDVAESYSWLKALGQPQATVETLKTPAAGELAWLQHRVTVPVGLKVKGLAAGTQNVALNTQTPAVLQWKFGRGEVCWLLGDPPAEKQAEVGRTFAAWAGVTPSVVSSDPRVQGFWLQQGERRFLVLSRFLGFGAIRRLESQKEKEPPIQTTISLPTLEPGRWRLNRILPAAGGIAPQVRTAAELKNGFPVTMDYSELQVVEFVAEKSAY